MIEILKLKQMLKKANIPFEFTDDKNHYKEIEATNNLALIKAAKDLKNSYRIIIYKHGKRLCDVIYGYGSYGYEQGLLEIMGGLTKEENENSSVLGYLTAEEVFKRFKYCYDNETNFYRKEAIYESIRSGK